MKTKIIIPVIVGIVIISLVFGLSNFETGEIKVMEPDEIDLESEGKTYVLELSDTVTAAVTP
ncbi:hypothetical protein Nisw_04680 [Candidatus Nitrosopumilus sp. SW]|uniref:hypothetical protein n=1 Tax=Candidatus Nitrosopumilus sp. SW TaxID=2508726 RepID=UPI001153E79E|nr:hypothetical protein [Candidatus Nitrosopumilus sp. SW]QDI88863.1 hypothetical protein Nisw_04680 [Candidatus Nitrosopumilus sp. SW]